MEDRESKITDRQLVELLLTHTELSVGEFAKILGQENKMPNITYHLKNLVERGIVVVHEKKKGSGSKYSLNDKKIKPTLGSTVLFSITLIFMALGIVFYFTPLRMFAFGYYIDVGVWFLAISALMGTASSFIVTENQRKEKLKTLLEFV